MSDDVDSTTSALFAEDRSLDLRSSEYNERMSLCLIEGVASMALGRISVVPMMIRLAVDMQTLGFLLHTFISTAAIQE